MFKYFWLFMPPVFFAVMMGAMIYIGTKVEHRTIRYDCSLAEISPDFPLEVKNKCRERLSGRI